jgi:hypothetical protein
MLIEEGLYGTAPQLHAQPQQQDLLIVPLNGTGGSQDHAWSCYALHPGKTIAYFCSPPRRSESHCLGGTNVHAAWHGWHWKTHLVAAILALAPESV